MTVGRQRPMPYPLRLSDDLRAKLQAKADEGSRSLHAEIEMRLESSLQENPQLDQYAFAEKKCSHGCGKD